MHRLLPHWQLLSAPWRQRLTEKSYGGIIAMAILLLVVGGVLGFLKGGDAQSMLRAFCGVGAGFIQVLWLLQLMAFVQFNNPTHARIVPGHLQYLRQTTLACWLMSSLLSGAILGLGFGNAGHWFLAAAVCMVVLATSLVWPALWFAAFFFPWWLDFGFADFVRQTGLPFYRDWPICCAVIILLLCARFLTHSLLRNGDAKHVSGFDRARRIRWSAMPNAQGKQATLHDWGNWGTRIHRVILFPLHRYMQYLIRNPKTTSANIMARAELIFGADVHWVMQVSIAACLAVLVAIACLIASWYWGPEWRDKLSPGWFGIAWCMLFVGLTPMMSLQPAFYRSKREQSLIMLLPGMPQGTALNRLIAMRVLRQASLTWLISACVALQLPYDADAAQLVAAAYIGVLPASALLVQDWSRMQMQRTFRAIFYFIAVMVGPVTCFIALRWRNLDGLWLLFASMMIALALVRWRWIRTQRFSAALPVGRLAFVDGLRQ